MARIKEVGKAERSSANCNERCGACARAAAVASGNWARKAQSAAHPTSMQTLNARPVRTLGGEVGASSIAGEQEKRQ